jgi:hypothetical protein
MASDGATFQVSIPSKKKFLVGPVAAERASSKPIENLRPQHLLDALLWPEIRKEEAVTVKEFNDENARYYILTVLRGGHQLEVLREIWFDRSDLQVTRMLTGNLLMAPLGRAVQPRHQMAQPRFRARFESTGRTMTTSSICRSRKFR